MEYEKKWMFAHDHQTYGWLKEVGEFGRSPWNLYKELIQNAMDQHLDKTKPVIVKFKIFELDRQEIPEFDDLANHIRESKIAAEKLPESANVLEEIQATIDFATSDDQVHVLQCSDFNTDGLTGPCEEGKLFHNLLFSSGDQTKLQGEYLGSAGKGKSVPFIHTQLRSVAYATTYYEEEKRHRIAMVKSILRSHQTSSDDQPPFNTKGIGFYPSYEGKTNPYPTLKDDEIPQWMAHDPKEQGATVRRELREPS